MNAPTPVSPLDEMHPLLRFATLLRIAHHIPGRVRLKLAVENGSGLIDAAAEAKRFIRSVTGVPGIRAVSLNPLALSCVVEYDPALISPSVWNDLVAGTRSAAAEALLQAIAAAARTAD
jgi:hypothetical protein